MVNSKASKIKSPDFIGIGAPRTGTTWLYEHLSRHPNIWMPPVKEIHFFDRVDGFSMMERKFRLDLKNKAASYIFPNKKKNRTPNICWDLNYFFRRPDFNWYSSLFLPERDQVTGEITPAYSLLDQKIVEKIFTYYPSMRIIFLMRDPIERAWSHAIKRLARDRKEDAKQISDEKFLESIIGRRNPYEQIIFEHYRYGRVCFQRVKFILISTMKSRLLQKKYCYAFSSF